MNAEARFSLGGSEFAGDAVLDIPHPALIDGIGPVGVVERFETTWGMSLKAVSLPVALPDGLMFPVDGLPDLVSSSGSRIRTSTGQEYDFRGLVSAFAAQGVDIYLTLDPEGQSLNMPALQLVDSQQDTSAAVCIVKRRTQAILSAVLGTGIDIALEQCGSSAGRLRGIGIDICNIWPMGATEGLIEATCFCSECIAAGGDSFEAILRDSRAFNLALADKGRGIGFIKDIRPGYNAEQLIELSRSRGFLQSDEASGPVLSRRADLLLNYMRTRHRLTTEAIESILQAALPSNEELVGYLISENADYSWTSGVFLEEYDTAGKVPAGIEELWIDPSGVGIGEPKLLRHRSYLWRRSRYMIDEFFQLAAVLADPRRRAITGAQNLSQEVARSVLRGRFDKALGAGVSAPSSLVSLPEPSTGPGGRVGFVAVALDRVGGEAFLRRLEIVPVHEAS